MAKSTSRRKDVVRVAKTKTYAPVVDDELRSSNPAIETSPRRAKVVAELIAKVLKKAPNKRFGNNDPDRLKTRASLIHPDDRVGLQRIMGERDILQVTFLHQAIAAGKSVCRLRIRSDSPGPPSFGTGFLVAPGVLLTNHHVLPASEAANLSLAEFDAELDLNYVERTLRIYNFLPDKLFVTDAELDFTFVAVNSVSHDGTPLSEFGQLPLLRTQGKAMNGEYATIIQHPRGQSKQIVIRENQIVLLPVEDRERIGASYVHYKSDTEPGSSGSPVLNDQLEVLALHHKSVPKYNSKGLPLARNGRPWTADMGEDQRAWVANEGIRISAIFERLQTLRHSNPHASILFALLEGGEPSNVFSTLGGRRSGAVQDTAGEAEPLEATALARRKGYDSSFLGFEVPLPKPTGALAQHVQPLLPSASPKGKVKGELVYTHFSVVMHAQRHMAILAAVNIDGDRLAKKTKSGSWRVDGRISRQAQADNELYRDNVLDKGHLVRRIDPAWGSRQAVEDAVADTYHYTNASPQEHSFNDGVWGDVEDYILQMAAAGSHRISVFTGPIFHSKDRVYGEERPGGPWRIPSRFWKVIVYPKADGTKSATGFILDQSDQIADLMEGFTPLPRAREVASVHQKTVQAVEKMTNLDFGDLRKFDPLTDLEATRQTRRIRLAAQILL